MVEDCVIGVDIQVAILNNRWVKPLHHPECKYGYIGDGEVSYLVSERFIPFRDNEYPKEREFWKQFKKLKKKWPDILKEQERLSGARQ